MRRFFLTAVLGAAFFLLTSCSDPVAPTICEEDSMAVVDQYQTTSGAVGITNVSNDFAFGQSFKVPANMPGTITAIKLKLSRQGSPSLGINVRIYPSTGTHGTDAVPGGAQVAINSDYGGTDVEVSATPSTWYTFTFSASLTPGATYIVSVDAPGADASNYILVAAESTSPAHAGNASFYDGMAWNDWAAVDLAFQVLGDAGVIAGNGMNTGLALGL
jgi:hypothetical protein